MMIRRVLLSVLAVSACSTQAASPPATTTTTTAATTTTTNATPTSTGPSLADLQAKADRAALAVDGMVDYGVAKAEIDEVSPTPLTMHDGLCGEQLSFTAPAGRYRMFSGDKILLHNGATSYQARTGASVVAGIAALAKKCTTWKDESGFNHKITIDTTIAQPAGVDGFFVFCDRTEDATKEFRYCSALLSRGDTVVEVTPTAHVSFPDPLKDLRNVVPRAAQRLLAA
jgi:hypothetical protein